MSDQAALLRRMVGVREGAEGGIGTPTIVPETKTPPLRMARTRATAIAVTSGKGGVGKSNLSVNLAMALAQQGERVALVDADLGLANADVLCGVQPLATIEQCLALRRPVLDCAVEVRGRFTLIPGASGVARLADLDASDRGWLLGEIESIANTVDWLIVDTGAGLGLNTVAFAAAADRVLVVTTPEPPSMADAYGMIKTLAPRVEPGVVQTVVNQARDEEDARGVWLRLDRVSRAFLARELPLAGWLPYDASLPQAVRSRVPLLEQSPNSPAARSILRLAQQMRGPSPIANPMQSRRHGAPPSDSQQGFLGRLRRLVMG
ncbi:MAG: MinD/ParA family protein [Phycisphaeraceae bacterium]|nr:MinD/ParA family protein [Phycisphaeraceae bacterium]